MAFASNKSSENRGHQLQSQQWILPLTLLTSAVFLYLEVFELPATPRLASGDQAIYLNHAARMLDGQVIYRDFDHFTLPGTDLLYATLFRVFGVRAWIPQAMLVLLGVTIAWLTITISKRLVLGAAAFLPAFLFLALPFSSYLDATHHWYSTLAAMGALAIVIDARTVTRLAAAGVMWGLATCFTQSTALGLFGFAIFLFCERRGVGADRRSLVQKELALFSGFATVLALNFWYVWKVGLRQFLYYTVVFVAKYYSADRFNTWHVYLRQWPDIHAWPNWLDLVAWPALHALIPLVYLFPVLWYRNGTPSLNVQQREQPILVAVTGLSLFLGIASSPAWNRLYTVSVPGLILFVWLVDSCAKKTVLKKILWASALALLVLKPLVTQIRWKAYLKLPTGCTAFLEPTGYQKMQWLLERTRPGEYFFGDALVCFALRLHNPARVDFLRPTDYTRPEQVQDVLQGLEKHQVRFVSWYSGLNVSTGLPGNHLAPVIQYLHDHYHLAKVFSNRDEIWERNLGNKPDAR